MAKNVIAYIDGFNLYFGLKDAGWRRYYWLNVHKLGEILLKPGQRLAGIRYFTARISAPVSKKDRQELYLEALRSTGEVQMFFGKFQLDRRVCRKCGQEDYVPNEKMTDVNIATQMIKDAFEDSFHTALLISGDSDLSGVVETVRLLFPRKNVIVAFPPRRYSAEMERIATAAFHIGRRVLAKSQFPDEFKAASGHILRRPKRWTSLADKAAARTRRPRGGLDT